MTADREPLGRVRRRLARSHGYLAVARDGVCGVVETPLFPPYGSDPDFVVLRLEDGPRSRYPAVSPALVEWVDPERELVFLNATLAELSRLPDSSPLVA
jgi:hypothetical protein